MKGEALGELARANRGTRFVEALGELAIKYMGIKSDRLVHQSLGYHDVLEQVYFFITIQTDDSAIELMSTDFVFDPVYDDEHTMEHVCATFQIDDYDQIEEVRKKLVEADVING